MSRKIGWQKYEDVIQSEMYSPIANMIFEEIASDVEPEEYEEEEMERSRNFICTKKFYETIALMSRFDCWIGHTNFNITNSIKNKLNEVDGIEVLNVLVDTGFLLELEKCLNFLMLGKILKKLLSQKEKHLEMQLKKVLDDKETMNIANYAASGYNTALTKDEIENCIYNAVWNASR